MTAVLGQSRKDEIADEIISHFNALFVGEYREVACLYWAKAAIEVLSQYGRRVSVQAGTAAFLRVPPELDDGVTFTHYSYEWHADNPLTIEMIKSNQMPEMHVWVADLDTKEIIDMTTGFQPGRCEQLTGLPWLAPELPRHFWGDSNEAYKYDIVYRPELSACFLAYLMLGNAGWGEPLEIENGLVWKQWREVCREAVVA